MVEIHSQRHSYVRWPFWQKIQPEQSLFQVFGVVWRWNITRSAETHRVRGKGSERVQRGERVFGAQPNVCSDGQILRPLTLTSKVWYQIVRKTKYLLYQTFDSVKGPSKVWSDICFSNPSVRGVLCKSECPSAAQHSKMHRAACKNAPKQKILKKLLKRFTQRKCLKITQMYGKSFRLVR